MNGKTALVLGATGGIGGSVARTLMQRGWQVRALVRQPARAAANWPRLDAPAWIAGDAMNAADVVTAALGGADTGPVDVIVHAVNPPAYRHWDRLVLPMLKNTLDAARAAGARIVLPGTLYNINPATTRLVEPTSPQRPTTRKGRIRVSVEAMLEQAAPQVPSLIVRAGDFFGPNAGGSWFSQCLVKPGKPVRSLRHPAAGVGHSWAYLPDVAETIARLLSSPRQLAPFECVTFEGHYDGDGRQMIAAIERAVGRPVPVRAFPWWLMRAGAPFGGLAREMAEIEPHWRHPVRLDNRRLVELIGDEPRTPLDVAVADTLIALGCLPGTRGAYRVPQPT